jgi:hypothetical protein
LFIFACILWCTFGQSISIKYDYSSVAACRTEHVSDTIKQLQAGKANSQYPLDAAFVATGNVSFVAGKVSVSNDTHMCKYSRCGGLPH